MKTITGAFLDDFTGQMSREISERAKEKNMELECIQKKLKEIEDFAKYDDEAAHSEEDELYRDFIRFVSMREDELGILAQEILKSQEIDFCRWCA